MLDFARKFLASERLRHAFIAILLAAMAAALTILRPLDIAVWSMQSKIFSEESSGEIVFFTDTSGNAGRTVEATNEYLLRGIEGLEDSGAELIVINTPIQKSANPELDKRLQAQLFEERDRVVLARPVRQSMDENSEVAQTDPYFEAGMRIASSDYQTDFLGFVWAIEAQQSDASGEYPSVWSVLAEDRSANEPIDLNYSITSSTIPQFDLARFVEGGSLEAGELSGKKALIGGLTGTEPAIKVPDGGYGKVPASLAHIVAAETAMRGEGQFISNSVTLLLFGLSLLFAVSVLRNEKARRWSYVVWSALFVVTIFVSAKYGVRVLLVDSLMIGVIFGGLRIAYHFRRRHLFIDPRSRLPNFVALRRDFEDLDDDSVSIVVAKITRLEGVFVSITPAEQGRYLRQVASRLSLGDDDVTIYYDGGKYFAFVLPKSDYPDLQSHLEGLRAVASQAVTVSKRALDVSMTIGADESVSSSASKRISSAIAAADQAREAYRPVFVISDFEADSETWDYSLQSRLEDALSQNRISIKLQPQVDIKTGIITGAEALARWVDEERGEIPPSQFILQCERVGRLDELTKRVLFKSFSASRSLHDAGFDARISVNVSAIQFVDNRIADLIEKMLVRTGADPREITIEMTESARVEDFAAARETMERVAKNGIKFSIDDFGVASANLDALYQLPFSELKIDRMFVDQITRSPAARAIVGNLIQLAKDMRITSVAEGIETRETLQKLTEMGCDVAQGYYLARPQALSQFEKTLSLQKDNIPSRSEYG